MLSYKQITGKRSVKSNQEIYDRIRGRIMTDNTIFSGESKNIEYKATLPESENRNKQYAAEKSKQISKN